LTKKNYDLVILATVPETDLIPAALFDTEKTKKHHQRKNVL